MSCARSPSLPGWGALILSAAVALAGCASSGRSTPPTVAPGSGSATSGAPVAASSSAYSSTLTVSVGDADNGGSFTVRAGTRVVVTLTSTYWTFAPVSAPTVLRGAAPVVVGAPPGVHTVPGMGLGTVRETFTAEAPGTAVVTAHRVSCGEAMRCVGGRGSYRITVLVRPVTSGG